MRHYHRPIQQTVWEMSAAAKNRPNILSRRGVTQSELWLVMCVIAVLVAGLYWYNTESHHQMLLQSRARGVAPDGQMPYDGVLWLPDGDLICTRWGGTVERRNGDSGEVVASWQMQRSERRELALHPSGKMFATANGRGEVELWDVELSSQPVAWVAHASEVEGLFFLDEGKTLLTVAGDQHVRYWSVADQHLIAEIDTPDVCTSSVALSPNGRLVAMGDNDGSVSVLDLQTRQIRKIVAAGTLEIAVEERVAYLDWLGTNNDELLVMTPHQLSRYHLPTGRTTVLGKAPDYQLHVAARSYDGTGLWTATRQGHLILWEIATGKQVQQVSGHHGLIRGIGWEPVTQQLATAGWDGRVQTWDAVTGANLLNMF